MYLSSVVQERLQERVPGLILAETGGAIPVEASGTLATWPFWFKYRGGMATLKVGGDWAVAPLYMSMLECGGEYCGELDEFEFAALMIRLVPQLKRSPRLWEFEGLSVSHSGREPEGGRVTLGAWAMTAAESYEKLTKPRDWLIRYGYTREQQWADIEACRLDPRTLTVDERKWPDPEPLFVVKASR